MNTTEFSVWAAGGILIFLDRFQTLPEARHFARQIGGETVICIETSSPEGDEVDFEYI